MANGSAPPSSSNPWFGISLGLLGLIVGFAISAGLSGQMRLPFPAAPTPSPTAQVPTPPPPPPTNDTPATADDDMILGKANAPVTLIEFVDYQCPFCRRFFEQTFPSIKKEYIDTGKVRFIVRDFPLSFHSGASPASISVECAADQSDTLAWKLHDEIFVQQGKGGELTAENIKAWASGISGMKAAALNECLDAQKYKDEVEKDLADGSASGIDGTPGFWILGPNGKSEKISGAYPFDRFKQSFDAMLK